jgi:tRNA-dihydrouridine synthase
LNFWKELNRPFFALAPMEDATDTVFREIILGISDPKILKVVFTEFTSTDGLLDERGYKRVSERLVVNNSEWELIKNNNVKLVAQIWGNNPEKFSRAAELITEIGYFQGIDINMGCPVKKVVKKNTCSALIKEPELAKDIVQATKSGTHLPVSVKTRIGFNSVVTEKWISDLLEVKPAAITLHGRTQKMQSEGQSDWNEIKKAVDLRNSVNSDTVMLGNGDVNSYSNGLNKLMVSGVEGIMVGRGVFRNPWIFNKDIPEISPEERIRILINHITIYQKTWEEVKSINLLKRFFKIYVNSFKGAADFRGRLMGIRNYDDLYAVLSEQQQFAKV